jgi:hypothetical protein
LSGYKKIILNKEGDETDWAKNGLEILNDFEYAELMIAQDDMCFGIIDGSRSAIFLDGDAAFGLEEIE